MTHVTFVPFIVFLCVSLSGDGQVVTISSQGTGIYRAFVSEFANGAEKVACFD